MIIKRPCGTTSWPHLPSAPRRASGACGVPARCGSPAGAAHSTAEHDLAKRVGLGEGSAQGCSEAIVSGRAMWGGGEDRSLTGLQDASPRSRCLS